MENLSLNDLSQGGGPVLGPAPGAMGGLAMAMPPPQLPPQMFTTAAQLLDLTDKKLMVALRDGRKLIGILRSWDQFANLVLQGTTERVFVPPSSSGKGLYADISRGVFLVRGENVLLLGEIDLDKDDDVPEGYERAEVEVVHGLARQAEALRKKKEKRRMERLKLEGFEGEGGDGI